MRALLPGLTLFLVLAASAFSPISVQAADRFEQKAVSHHVRNPFNACRGADIPWQGPPRAGEVGGYTVSMCATEEDGIPVWYYQISNYPTNAFAVDISFCPGQGEPMNFQYMGGPVDGLVFLQDLRPGQTVVQPPCQFRLEAYGQAGDTFQVRVWPASERYGQTSGTYSPGLGRDPSTRRAGPVTRRQVAAVELTPAERQSAILSQRLTEVDIVEDMLLQMETGGSTRSVGRPAQAPGQAMGLTTSAPTGAPSPMSGPSMLAGPATSAPGPSDGLWITTWAENDVTRYTIIRFQPDSCWRLWTALFDRNLNNATNGFYEDSLQSGRWQQQGATIAVQASAEYGGWTSQGEIQGDALTVGGAVYDRFAQPPREITQGARDMLLSPMYQPQGCG